MKKFLAALIVMTLPAAALAAPARLVAQAELAPKATTKAAQLKKTRAEAALERNQAEAKKAPSKKKAPKAAKKRAIQVKVTKKAATATPQFQK